MSLRDAFLRPPAIDHPTPFWFWNDVLEPDEVRRQMEAFLDQAMGGAFLHARMGRVTPYMGEEWMAAVAAALDVARARGGHAWIYDEDNWPSGYAGGKVCDLGPDYLQKYVCAKLFARKSKTPIEVHGPVLGVYTGTAVDDQTLNVHRIEAKVTQEGERYLVEPSQAGGDAVLVCFMEHNDTPRYFSPECGVTGYVDVMDAKVTDAFLRVTHEVYRERFGEDFGQAIPGFFIDEPNYMERGWPGPDLRRPWTGALPEVYRARTNRDLLDDLPGVFFDCGDTAYIRYHFHECVSHLFVTNFTKRIADYCARHGLLETGHVIVEEHPRAATQTVGNPMAHYEVMHVPGIDHLGRDIDMGAFWSSSRVLVKQVASVKHQMGQARTMCETFAGGGWDFGVLEQKWMGDFLSVLGVTLICQHAVHYSLRGYRKRDYPPSLSYQQPWWEHSAGMNRHFGRLGHLQAIGRHVTRIGVLHPMGSFFATHDVRDMAPSPDPLHDCFKQLTNHLVERQLDFDFLDEGILARHGKVEDGVLHVGRARYDAVLAPHMLTVRATTLELLRTFMDQGGQLATLGPWPVRVDGAVNHRASIVFSRAHDLGPWDGERSLCAAEDWLRRAAPPALRLRETPPHPVFVQHLTHEDGEIFLLCCDTTEPFEAEVEVRTANAPQHWNTLDESVEPLPARREGEAWVVSLPFHRGRSHVLVAPQGNADASPDQAPDQTPQPRVVEVLPKATAVPSRRLSPNALALDRCMVRLDDEAQWHGPRLVLHVVKREQGSSYAGDGTGREGVLTPGRRAALRFTVKSEIDLTGAVLAVETPNVFHISVNGQALDTQTDDGWFVDTSLRRLPLPDLPAGNITVELSCDYNGEQEFETLFLLGDFDVALLEDEPVLRAPTSRLTVGSWTDQGLPFYAGKVVHEIALTLDEKPEAARLCCDWLRHTARVRVNGQDCGCWLWPPFQVEVGHALQAGENQIEIEVANSLRNLYGPHHLKQEDEIPCLGPMEILQRSRAEIAYQFKPAGLLSPVRLEI